MKLTYSIYYPGGNTTALVNQLILDPALKKKINDQIMSLNPLVEQVGFVSQRSNRLEMAGGEFCGNATRCAAFYYLKGRPGKIKINVSGVRQKLSAGIDQKNNCWAQIPVKKLVKKQKYSVVILEGITQVITNGKATQNKAKAILKKLNLLNAVPAAGVMFIQKSTGQIKLNPFVWVRDIKTFFNETACASGTAAVGVFLANKSNQSVNLPILQPSGEKLQVLVKYISRSLFQVTISNPIKLVKENLYDSI